MGTVQVGRCSFRAGAAPNPQPVRLAKTDPIRLTACFYHDNAFRTAGRRGRSEARFRSVRPVECAGFWVAKRPARKLPPQLAAGDRLATRTDQAQPTALMAICVSDRARATVFARAGAVPNHRLMAGASSLQPSGPSAPLGPKDLAWLRCCLCRRPTLPMAPGLWGRLGRGLLLHDLGLGTRLAVLSYSRGPSRGYFLMTIARGG